MKPLRSQAGFTLVELLLAIAIMSILASIVIIAVDPVSQIRKALGAERTHYANQLQKAIRQYIVDNGTTPSETSFSLDSENPSTICRLGQSDGTCLNIDEISPVYLSCMPYDTLEEDTNLSGYTAYERAGFIIVESVYDSPDAAGGIECLEVAEPVASFRFAEPTGSTLQDDTSSYTATVTNMTAPSGFTANTGPTEITTSWTFDGADDLLSIPYSADFDLTSSLTLTAWVRPSSFGVADVVNAIARKGEANPNTWQLAIEDGYLTLILEGGDGLDGAAQSAGQLSLNTWQHVAGVWDGTTASVFVNGVEVGSGAYVGTDAGELATDGRDVYIGGRAGSDYYAGNMYDLRIYDTALTDVHIGKIAGGKM